MEIGDPAELAPGKLDEALAESPGYVEAAITRYGLMGDVPGAPIEAATSATLRLLVASSMTVSEVEPPSSFPSCG